MSAVADDDDVLEVLTFRNAGQVLDLLFGVDRVCLRDNAVEGDAVGEQIVSAYAAFGFAGVFVGTAAQRDDDGCHATLVEADGLIKAGVQHWRGTAGVLGRAKDSDGVCGLGVVDLRGGFDLVIDPTKPRDSREQQKQHEAAQKFGGRASLGSLRL